MSVRLFLILSILLCLQLRGQENTKDYTEAFKLIEVWLDAQKDYEALPGISAIVVKDQEVLWQGGYGMANREEKVATTAETICSICSISKLFTAVAVMKLYEEGKLRIDDEVSDLLPWYNLQQQFPDSGPVTVRSLLTHSSGLPREANFPYWTGPDFPFPSEEQVRAELGKQETLYPASTYFQYSNLGLTLLGEIVTQVSGMPYEQYIQKNILDPLQLTDTRTELPQSLYGKQLAIGYGALKRDGSRDRLKLFQANGITAAAGFSSNVSDLGQFASWQFRLLDTTTTEILKPATLRYMQQVHYTDPGWDVTWGLGFAVRKADDGGSWVSHGGSCPGYRSVLMLHPGKELAYSVMINANGTNPGKYAMGMHKILSKVKEHDKDSEDGPDLSPYTGYYDTQPWGSEAYIGSLNGQLVELYLPADNPAEAMTFYKHIEGDTFRRVRDDDELGETLEFERDANGRVTRLKNHDNYARRIRD
ncbi:serine hydrolase [Zeaxanthinibacter enoshimensis]|uniref:CubicO group peptidase (Beta-lactamase class C family) n=1 Tax=Zeaxanthinibacter enoshimensis TaxID=392009 RepID=A0A4R6TVM5_9FLAO|nr:serine hydrolase [Zeaxanthinibacter enoshimensis]TDQ32988.1 CubicO group peptidase (beta-lactamase class C family) [Zeaxanthinibacter enoshimensis]